MYKRMPMFGDSENIEKQTQNPRAGRQSICSVDAGPSIVGV